MRIQGTKYATMKNAMRAVVEHHGPDRINEIYSPLSKTEKLRSVGVGRTVAEVSLVNRMLWDLWDQANHNLRYDDMHPCFQNGLWTRICPQNATFDIYSNDDNDEHIKTALRSIGRELGIC